MQEYKVERHASSFLPDGEWKMVWNDEFDADQLDRSKWDFRYSMMGKRAKHFSSDRKRRRLLHHPAANRL